MSGSINNYNFTVIISQIQHVNCVEDEATLMAPPSIYNRIKSLKGRLHKQIERILHATPINWHNFFFKYEIYFLIIFTYI